MTTKTASFPSLRVDSQLRAEAEGVLREGETLSGLIETAVREAIHRRRTQSEFLERGLQAGAQARLSGSYHPAKDVHDELQRRLDARRKRTLG